MCPRPDYTNVTQNLKHRKSYKIIRCIGELRSPEELPRNPSRGYSDELIPEYLLSILRRQAGSNETGPKQKCTAFKCEKSTVIYFLPVCQIERFLSATLGKEPAKFSKKNVLDNNPYLMKLYLVI